MMKKYKTQLLEANTNQGGSVLTIHLMSASQLGVRNNLSTFVLMMRKIMS